MPAYCVKLDKVPGLPFEARATFRKVLATNKQMGVHNVPRRFNPEHLAQLGQVRIHCLALRAYVFSLESHTPSQATPLSLCASTYQHCVLIVAI